MTNKRNIFVIRSDDTAMRNNHLVERNECSGRGVGVELVAPSVVLEAQ
jgi:hypothetical protein